MNELIYEHTVATGVIAAGLAIAVLFGLFTFRRHLATEWSTLALALLRLAFLAVLGWCLFMPLVKRTHVSMLKPRFVVAIDTSASMALSPAPDISNRWTVAQGLLAQPWKQALAAECGVDVYPFAADLGAKASLEGVAGLSPDGASTQLRECLSRITDRYKGQKLAGLLLLSDGVDTREGLGAWVKQKWPCPIYTVRLEPFVSWSVQPDVRIDTIAASRRVTIGWSSELKAMVSGEGTGGRVLNVRLLGNGRQIQELPTQLPAEGGSREVVFQLTHDEVGTFTYEVRVPPFEGEVNTNDNAFAVTVQVLDAKNRLLYVESIPRWESKYLVRTLNAVQNLTPLAFVRGAGNRFIALGARGGASLDLTEDELTKQKIVILGDLDAEALGAARCAALVKFVENGGSLVLLGGPAAWGRAGFEASDLRRALPVRRPALQPAAEGRFQMRLTAAGRTHPAFSADAKSWEALPPVLSIFPGAEAAPGAVALVAAATDRGEEPIIFSQRYGQGKVVAILTDSLWKWQLTPGKEKAHFRFWNQVLQWLIPVEAEVASGQLDLFADRDQVLMGETITLNARLSGVDRLPAEGLKCEIRAPDGRKLPFAMAKQNVVSTTGKSYSGYSVQFMPEAPGLYRAVAVAGADAEGRAMESAPYSFFVKPYTPESAPRPLNVDLLKALAAESGGRFLEPEELSAALSALEFRGTEEESVSYSSPWNNVPVLACLLALLAIEWIFRKARNMA